MIQLEIALSRYGVLRRVIGQMGAKRSKIPRRVRKLKILFRLAHPCLWSATKYDTTLDLCHSALQTTSLQQWVRARPVRQYRLHHV